MRAKGMRRCLADRGSTSTTSRTRTRTAVGSLHVAAGEAECATTHTEHWASSRELECVCAAKLYADTNVSNRQSHATGFRARRMRTFAAELPLESTMTWSPAQVSRPGSDQSQSINQCFEDPGYPCQRYSSASGSVCCRTARSTCTAFRANTNW